MKERWDRGRGGCWVVGRGCVFTSNESAQKRLGCNCDKKSEEEVRYINLKNHFGPRHGTRSIYNFRFPCLKLKLRLID